MNQGDKPKFAEMMATACAVYDKPPMEKEALRAYWLMLESYPIDKVLYACNVHMKGSRFFPKPAELIAEINRANQRPMPNTYILPRMNSHRRAVANRLMMSLVLTAGGVPPYTLKNMVALKNVIADEWPEGHLKESDLEDLENQLQALVNDQDKAA